MFDPSNHSLGYERIAVIDTELCVFATQEAHLQPKRGRFDKDAFRRRIAANARLIAAAPELRAASQSLYDAIQAYLIDNPDRDLPKDLVDAFDAMESAWNRADNTG